MNKITSINQLIKTLSASCDADLKNIYKFLNIPISEYEPYIFWSDENYTRNCIVRTDKYELLLLCWKKNQYTPIHSHNGQECWVYNVKGTFEEIRYELNSEKKLIKQNDFSLNEGHFSYMNNQLGFHELKANEEAISLHLYSLPIDECLIYDSNSEQFKSTSLSYHSTEGKLNH